MKKFLSAMSIALGLGFATAQQAHPATHTQTVPVKKTTTTQTVKKADGKTATVKTTTVQAAPAVKMKADGTPDKRYKQNQHLKKDGTPDKRFKENK